ncbi:MAG TPA: VanZ family protein [Woeseiaceae bacterium]|nr:VanZ family protein [Woeseiaceae bacterium]
MASLLILIMVLIAALMPAVWFWDDRVKGIAWFQSVDKWLHGITFLVLTVWFAGLYKVQSYWRIALGLLAFGLLIELCQRMVTYRTADWLDVGADAVGIIAGLAISLAGAGGWSQRLEARLVGDRS